MGEQMRGSQQIDGNYKNQMKILELENTVSSMKGSLDGLSSRMYKTKQKKIM